MHHLKPPKITALWENGRTCGTGRATAPKTHNNAAEAQAWIESKARGDRRVTHHTDKPLAAEGLIAYRCKGPFGWIMIGATDDEDAMNEARRSTDKPGRLERWNGEGYEEVTTCSD